MTAEPERRRLVALAAVMILAAACGSRQSHDSIVAAWETGGPALQPGAGFSDVGPGTPAVAAEESLGPVTSSADLPGTPTSTSNTAMTVFGRSAVGGAPAGGGSSTGSGPPGAIQPAPGKTAGNPSSGPSAPSPELPLGGTTVLVGNVSTLSGPVGATVGDGPKAVQAWAAAVNARGGINGYKVKVRIADDGSDPARHRALAQEMVERVGIVAFLNNAAPLSGQGAVSYIQQVQVPVIGSEGGSRWMLENSMYFPQVPTMTFLKAVNAGALAAVAVAEKKTKVAVFICEFAECKNAVDSAAFKAAGLEVVHEGVVSLTSPDYTADCLSARNAGAASVFIELDPPSVVRFADSCGNVGFRPLYGGMATSLQNVFLGRPELEGATFGSPNIPFLQATNPSIKEFQTVMARYAPSVPPLVAASTGWVSAKLFELVLQRLSTPQPTPADILKALWSVKQDDLGGITVPLTFEPGTPNNAGHLRACWWTIRARAGQWVSPDNGQRHCQS